jgi:hypothetical protein
MRARMSGGVAGAGRPRPLPDQVLAGAYLPAAGLGEALAPSSDLIAVPCRQGPSVPWCRVPARIRRLRRPISPGEALRAPYGAGNSGARDERLAGIEVVRCEASARAPPARKRRRDSPGILACEGLPGTVYLRHLARPFHQNPSAGLVVDRACEDKACYAFTGTVKRSCSTSSQPPAKTSRHRTNTRRPSRRPGGRWPRPQWAAGMNGI